MPAPDCSSSRRDAAGLTRTGYRTFEGGRAAHVAFDGTPATPLGDVAADQSSLIDDVVARAQVAYCHEALGAMDTALKLTVEYLKTRKQFGVTAEHVPGAHVPRGRHVRLARAGPQHRACGRRSCSLDEPSLAREAAARAKLQVSTAGRHIGQEAIQLHGGIGMTAEYSVGHYMSRLTAIDHWLGDGTEHLRTLAGTLDDHTVLNPLP